MKRIYLGNDKFALISDEDAILCFYDWCLGNNGYALRRIKKKAFFLHNVIAERMGLDITKGIDHEDRNKFNYQRFNLREANQSQNLANRALNKNNTTGYKGVCYFRASNKYEAKITVNYSKKHLGLFETVKEAAKAYDKAAKFYFGEFAWLNFPGE